jgi:hypothetical protein
LPENILEYIVQQTIKEAKALEEIQKVNKVLIQG